MPFDAREIFANLAEKEKIKGHHSSEGRAIRVLSRALNGWVGGNLSSRDVIVLCDQAMEDWIKMRLGRSPWSAPTLSALITAAVSNDLIRRAEVAHLRQIHNLHARADRGHKISPRQIERALEFCLQLLDKRW